MTTLSVNDGLRTVLYVPVRVQGYFKNYSNMGVVSAVEHKLSTFGIRTFYLA